MARATLASLKRLNKAELCQYIDACDDILGLQGQAHGSPGRLRSLAEMERYWSAKELIAECIRLDDKIEAAKL